uniref:Secreted protein n=1 Tax=Ascaris lumbricoides TaxID=6252 RepID=A0A0M3HRX3_ASCLU
MSCGGPSEKQLRLPSCLFAPQSFSLINVVAAKAEIFTPGGAHLRSSFACWVMSSLCLSSPSSFSLPVSELLDVWSLSVVSFTSFIVELLSSRCSLFALFC